MAVRLPSLPVCEALGVLGDGDEALVPDAQEQSSSSRLHAPHRGRVSSHWKVLSVGFVKMTARYIDLPSRDASYTADNLSATWYGFCAPWSLAAAILRLSNITGRRRIHIRRIRARWWVVVSGVRKVWMFVAHS